MTKIRIMLPDGEFEDKMVESACSEYWLPAPKKPIVYFAGKKQFYVNLGTIFKEDKFLSEVAGMPVFTEDRVAE